MNFMAMWAEMGFGARLIVITLGLMSIYSMGVMVERILAIRKSKRESRMYADKLARALEAGADDVAIAAAEPLKAGYLPRVLGSGLREYQLALAQGKSPHEVIELTERGLDRAQSRM